MRQLADQVLSDVHRPLTIIIPEQSDVAALTTRWPRFRVLGAKDLEPPHAYARPADIAPDTIADLLFTSGSTGVPKGVMVTHANIVRFVDVMCERYELSEQDRFSQTFPLTFDLAGFDMFMAWEVGGCICCPSPGELLMAGAYVCAARLTVWFSVPLLALHMKRSGMLEPDQYPALRYSLFCGEALPAEVLIAWAKAAPNSILENLYGPTELTLACTLYRWDCRASPGECEGWRRCCNSESPIREWNTWSWTNLSTKSRRPEKPGNYCSPDHNERWDTGTTRRRPPQPL